MPARLVVALLWVEAFRLVDAADRLSASTANLTNSSTSVAKHIRIAFVHHNTAPFTAMRHLISHLGPAGSRSLLPDYEITIDSFPIEPNKELTPVAVVNILDDKTPTYSAIAGPNSDGDALAMVNVVAAARMLHVHKGTSSVLSDRTLYPYTFRASRSIQGILSTSFHLLAVNAWSAVASVWTETDTFEYSVRLAAQLNITNYATLVEWNQASWAVEAWQAELIDLIRSTRLRIIVIYVNVDVGWQLACKVYEEQLAGLQFFVPPFAGWVNGWFLSEDFAPQLGQCTPDQIYATVAGHLGVVHMDGSPGVTYQGLLHLPAVTGDYSQLPLTCTPNLSPHQWYNNPDHILMAVEDKVVYDLRSAFAYFLIAGSDQDQVCQILLAMHDVLYRKGHTLESIERRDEASFMALIASVQEVDFIGVTGNFRYYNNTPDPVYIYHFVTQMALPTLDNVSQAIQAAVTWPDGPSGEPQFQELYEQYPVARLQWQDGSMGFGPNEAGFYPDCGAVNGELKWRSCVPCPPGTSYDQELRRCRMCAAGQYQSQSGSASCLIVEPGFFSAFAGATRPSPCPAGHECPQAGMTQPQPCAKGRFAGQPEQVSCDLCPVGTYQEEDGGYNCSRCDLVLARSITANLASQSPQACICPEGSYRGFGDGSQQDDTCLACLEGLTCPEGSDMRNLPRHQSASQELNDDGMEASLLQSFPYPQAKRGYMTRMSNPLQVYLCSEEKHCPGGPPGSCDRYRDTSTRACGDCESDAFDTGDECEPCGDASALPFLAFAVVGGSAAVVAALLVNRDVHKVPGSSLMIMVASGMMITSIQSMTVLSQMSIAWLEPVKGALKLTTLVSFDLKILKVGCVLGVNPVRSFAFRQTPPLVAIPLMAMTLLFKKYCRRGAQELPHVLVELTNAIGTLYTVFFISIIISAMDPFICYKHPGDSGESVRSAPSLLCFQGGSHAGMIVISILAVCVVPLPFVAVCGYAILVYGSKTVSNGRRFLHAFRFLFFRFTPQCYYFQIFVFMRSLGLCLAPVVFRAEAATQVLFMCVVLSSYSLCVCLLSPWRSKTCTTLDAVMTTLLLILLICGALSLDKAPQDDAVAALSIGIFVAVFTCGVLFILNALRQRLTPRPYYHYFICHHKAHAAAQARFLKILLLGRKRSAEVFIDSDNLQDLDSLFDIVKSRVGHLLIYLTSETLKRPWCVGEVVTALRAGLRITRLHMPSFAFPSEDQRQDPMHYVDTTGCNLSEYGIEWDDVTRAFDQVSAAGVPQIKLDDRLLGTRKFDQLAAAVLKQNNAEVNALALPEKTGSVFVATDADSDEANASGGILAARIGEDVVRVCEQDLVMLSDYKADLRQKLQLTRSAWVGVLILSADCLNSLDLVSVICELSQLHQLHGSMAGPGVVSVNTPGFVFPAAAQIEKLCQEHSANNITNGSVAAHHIKSFFKHISIVLPTFASQQELNTQANEVFRRVGVAWKAKKQSRKSSDLIERTPVHSFALPSTSTTGAPREAGNKSADTLLSEANSTTSPANDKDWPLDVKAIKFEEFV